MATTIKSTQLDFDFIKNKLKEKFKEQTEFQDYNFEASGLNNLLDVLALNSHFNGLTANFALNESFINTAQLRSSVVAHAETLGYVPTSYTSSQAKLNLSILITTEPRPTSVTLERGAIFTASVDDVSYTFQTRQNFVASDDGTGSYEFQTSDGVSQIPVFEGTEKIKTFIVGEKADAQVYVIPDVTMDTSTIRVRVFDTLTGTTFTTYTNIQDAVRVTDDSALFQIKEVPNGFYELIFGDGLTTGKTPVAGNKIVVDYLSTQGAVANGAKTFTTSVALSVLGVNYPLTATTSSASAGGAFKESIESIRRNAPIAFSSQKRLVTADDYRAQILANFGTFLDDVIAWGGHDNVPQIYGRVFAGLKFKSNIDNSTREDVKNRIKNDLSENLAIMSIDLAFADAITTKLTLSTFFNLDPDLTSSTSQSVENLVQGTINSFFSTNLKKFNKVFRRSNLLTAIDALDVAILNSRMDVKMQREQAIDINQSVTYSITFPTTIAEPDDVNRIITSSLFTLNSRTCSIRNALNSNKLEVVDQDGTIQVDNIGSYSQTQGLVTLTGFAPSAIQGNFLKVNAVPANQGTIRPLRNYVLDIDTVGSISTAVIDNQNTLVTL
tara:strand:- start:869 stop:2698 length:1830 start_codon:yes stop_codon:yes gene_type:complete